MRACRCSLTVAVLTLVSVTCCTLRAAPYASGVRNTSGNTWEFVLNMPADDVTVLRDGGNAVNFGSLGAGRWTFDMTNFSSFDIAISNNASDGWTTISDVQNLFTSFEQPVGLAVNTDPTSPYFGTIYVNNSRVESTRTNPPSPDPPRPPRNVGSGVYAMTADMIGVDLANNFAIVTDPQDTSQAKAPGWTANQTSVSPWRMTLDEGGNLIISDFSDNFGGIKYASPDLTSGGLVLDGEGNNVLSSVQGPFGPLQLHGAIASKPTVTGTLGVDLTVWAVDEHLDPELHIPNINGNSVWRWDVGSDTNHTINPTLVINVGELPPTVEDEPRPTFRDIGTPANAHFDPTHNKWYLTQNRLGTANTGDSAGLIVVTADGVDGNSPTLEWSSLQFSIDHDLDGHTALDGIQDIFRHAGSVTISPDGTQLFVHRSRMLDAGNADNNPVLGVTSNAPGIILVIPLDENGIPDITVESGVLTNIQSISTIGNNRFHTNHEVTFDAAGNLYITHSDSELLEVFSPGGNTLATTSWDGSQFAFGIQTLVGVSGDHNGDGVVDAADYVLWRKSPGDFGNQQGYDDWRANFGAGSGGGAAAGGSHAAVPEPGSLALVALGLALVAGCRAWRRR